MAINGRNVVDLVKKCSKTLSISPKVSFYSSIPPQGKLASKPVVKKMINLDDAYQRFDEMLHAKPLPSVKDFNKLLTLMSKSQHHSHVVELFQRLRKSKVNADIFTINIVTKSCCGILGTRGGFTVLGCGIKSDVVPDIYTFSTLLNGLVEEGKIRKGEHFFNMVIGNKLCVPNHVFYSTMIKGFCEDGSIDKAIALLRKMQETGVKPNVITYSTIITGCCNINQVDEALKIFREMKIDEDIRPDLISYNAIIDGLSSLSRFKEVKTFLADMKNDKIDPDVVTYTPLVKVLSTLGRVANASAFVTMIIKKGLGVDPVVYTSLIDGYSLRGEMKNAVHVFKNMKCNELLPDVVTYNSLINGFCRTLAISDAIKYFHEISRVDLKPTVETYNTMIHGMFKAGKVRDGCILFNTMEAHDKITFRIIVEGLFENKQTNGAFELFHLISKAKSVSDLNLYNILLKGSVEIGNLRWSHIILGKLIVNGLRPDTITCNVIMTGLYRNGLSGEAKKWLFKMDEVCDSVTYMFMISLLLKEQNRVPLVKQLLIEMNEKGLRFDVAAYHTLVRAGVDQEIQDLIRKYTNWSLGDC